MTGRWLLNGLLLAVCTLLLLLARWQPDAPAGLAERVGLEPAAIARIRLWQRDEPALVLERNGDRWVMRAPLQGAVSASMQERLDALLRAPVSLALALPAAPGQGASERSALLADLGLDYPWLELELNTKRLSAGAAEPIDRRRYLRVGDTVLLIDDRWLLPLLGAPEDYLPTTGAPSAANSSGDAPDAATLPRP